MLFRSVKREIVVDYGADQRLARIAVHDERGGEVFDYQNPQQLERPYRVALSLPLGRFTFTVETAGGGRAETGFVMTSLEKDQPPVVLQAK